MRNLLLIAIAGALGSVSRYAVSGWAYRLLGERLPYGTLAVNVLGSFALGAVFQVALTSDLLSPAGRLFLSVGFLGAFTTFSTFSYETIRYLQDGAWSAAATNVGANLVLGLVAAWSGLAVARGLLGGA